MESSLSKSPKSCPDSPSFPDIDYHFFDSEFAGVIIPDFEEDRDEMIPEMPEIQGDSDAVPDLPESGDSSPNSLVDLEDWATDWSPERQDSYLRMLALICPGLPNLWVV